MEKLLPHHQWHIMVNVFIESGKYFDVKKINTKNDDEASLMQFCMRNKQLSKNISKWLAKLTEPTYRSLKLTNEFRTKGNNVFDKVPGQNDLAADYYTQAIFSAPKNFVELALAHANRAACSVTSDRFFEEGYFDCKLALNYNYPKEKLTKLFERKEFLAARTEKRDEYRFETYLEMKNLNFELDDEKKTFLKTYESRVSGNEHDNTEQKQKQSNGKRNLNEKYHPFVGRHQVASKAIKENELIYSEKAFSFVPLLSDKILYSCQCCGSVNCLPFPCNDCSRVSYCTPLCLNNHKNLHKYECAGYQKNLWIKVDHGYLAFRTTIIGFKDLLDRLTNTKNSKVQQVWSYVTTETPAKYVLYNDVFRLATNLDKIPVKHLLKNALTAHMLTIYLSEYTDFFETLPKECAEIMSDTDDWKILVASVIMRHISQADFNQYKTFEINLKPPSDVGKSYGYDSYNLDLNEFHSLVTLEQVFVAFFPKYSLCNHSCNPNTRIQANGPILSMYASRDIGENEEIYVCYGPHYKWESLIDRQGFLIDHYYFMCTCDKCETNDIAFKKYYAYYCPKENCCSLIKVKDDFKDYCRWWNYLSSFLLCKRIDEQLKCKKCNTRLPLNSVTVRNLVASSYGYTKGGPDYYETDGDVITETTLEMYFNMSSVLGKHHELKSDMAEMVLKFKTLNSIEKLFPRLAYITMEYFVNYEERYTQYHLSFVVASLHALKLLNMMKEIERTNTSPEMARDIAKIRKILDTKLIAEAYSILSKPMQIIFKNALQGAIGNVKSIDNNVSNNISLNGSLSDDSEKSVG